MTTRSMAKRTINVSGVTENLQTKPVKENQKNKKENDKMSNPLFKTFESLIKEDNTVYGIIDYIHINKMFPDSTYINNKDWSNIIYEIPYDDWLNVTGIDDEMVGYLNDMIEPYCGSINVFYEGSLFQEGFLYIYNE